MDTSVPREILDVGFDFWWDPVKVWKLDIPVTQMELSELSWHFDYPFWDENGARYNLKPQDVIDFPAAHPIEYTRIQSADMSHPIDIMKHPNGHWVVLDGLHRLVKACMEARMQVDVRIIGSEKIPDILDDKAIASGHRASMKYIPRS